MKIPKDKDRFRTGVTISVVGIFIIVLVELLKGFHSADLYFLGIRPRTIQGLIGILTAPVLHADLQHLLSNSFPLLFAIPGIFYFYYKDARWVIVAIYLLSGFWVWLTGRDAVHLGASGVVNGLLSFLFFAGLFQKNRAGIALALIVVFLYGAPILAGFFPKPGISFEAHISGATAGLFMAVLLSFDFKKKSKKE